MIKFTFLILTALSAVSAMDNNETNEESLSKAFNTLYKFGLRVLETGKVEDAEAEMVTKFYVKLQAKLMEQLFLHTYASDSLKALLKQLNSQEEDLFPIGRTQKIEL